MKVAIFLLALISCTFAHDNSRIVGGSLAEITEAPYQVALLYDSINGGSYTLRCGGVILNMHAIITTAKCVQGTEMSRWRARIGSKEWNGGGQMVGIMMAMIPTDFNNVTQNNNVAVLHLSQMLNLDGVNAKEIEIAEEGEDVANGTEALATGWGSQTSTGLSSLVLRKVSIKTLSSADCVKAYEGISAITDSMLCAGDAKSGTCTGDEGGPLVAGNKLIGISSFGGECVTKGTPGVWTKIAAVSTWIQQNGSHHPRGHRHHHE